MCLRIPFFFGGTNADLTEARKFNYCPILRKDFIIDEYQIIESKSIGADAILLLANVLSKEKIKQFTTLAQSIGLEVLLEIRDKNEIDTINDKITAVGINNRDLKTFETNIEHSFEMADLIPNNFIKVSESGIETVETIHRLREKGFTGFLIGDLFMRNSRPEKACLKFISELNQFKAELV